MWQKKEHKWICWLIILCTYEQAKCLNIKKSNKPYNHLTYWTYAVDMYWFLLMWWIVLCTYEYDHTFLDTEVHLLKLYWSFLVGLWMQFRLISTNITLIINFKYRFRNIATRNFIESPFEQCSNPPQDLSSTTSLTINTSVYFWLWDQIKQNRIIEDK